MSVFIWYSMIIWSMEERQGPQNVLGVTIEEPLVHLSEPLGITIFFHGPRRKGETESHCLPRVQKSQKSCPCRFCSSLKFKWSSEKRNLGTKGDILWRSCVGTFQRYCTELAQFLNENLKGADRFMSEQYPFKPFKQQYESWAKYGSHFIGKKGNDWAWVKEALESYCCLALPPPVTY